MFPSVINVRIRHDGVMIERLSISHQMAIYDYLSRSEAESMENLDRREVVCQNTESILLVMMLHKGVILILVEYSLRQCGRGAGAVLT